MSTTSTASSSRRRSTAADARLTPGVPTRPSEAVALLRELGVTPSRSLGQSILTDAFVADAEAALTDAQPDTPVVEIGGGPGILTDALLRRGLRRITVVEKDRRFADHLSRTFGDRVEVVCADARTADLPKAGVVVGNLPFSVTTPILLRLFSLPVPRIVALVQREVAERLGASEGSKAYGRLSIVAALHGEIELHQVVPAGAFTPTPAVDGRLFVFRRRPGPLPVPSIPKFERMVAALFSSRRKQLGNLVPRVSSGSPPAEVAAAAGWPETWARMRPEELPPDAYFRLARALHGPVAPRSARQL